jgi:hypothetical protein
MDNKKWNERPYNYHWQQSDTSNNISHLTKRVSQLREGKEIQMAVQKVLDSSEEKHKMKVGVSSLLVPLATFQPSTSPMM